MLMLTKQEYNNVSCLIVQDKVGTEPRLQNHALDHYITAHPDRSQTGVTWSYGFI